MNIQESIETMKGERSGKGHPSIFEERRLLIKARLDNDLYEEWTEDSVFQCLEKCAGSLPLARLGSYLFKNGML